MQELYDDLMNLQTKGFASFFYKDVTTILGTKCRIFSYNFASYSDWLKPNALESRGIMFEIDENEKPVRIMSRPMEKFFNLGENPFTMNIDFSKVDYTMYKEDGSLISTYHDNGMLFVKSKESLTSSQAMEAKQVLLDIRYRELADRVLQLAIDGYTCNFEYVSPSNRIVLNYDQRDLILLNVRNNETGEYVPISELRNDPSLRRHVVAVGSFDGENNPEEQIENIRQMTDAEGFIFQMQDGMKFKLKTEWYVELHKVKNNLNNNEALFQVVAGGGSDDMKSFYSDDYSKTKIEKFEKVFFDYLDENTTYLLLLHRKLIGADRKTVAVTGQTEMRNDNKLELFSVLMKMHDGVNSEEAVNLIIDVFLKNCKKYVPKEYETS